MKFVKNDLSAQFVAKLRDLFRAGYDPDKVSELAIQFYRIDVYKQAPEDFKDLVERLMIIDRSAQYYQTPEEVCALVKDKIGIDMEAVMNNLEGEFVYLLRKELESGYDVEKTAEMAYRFYNNPAYDDMPQRLRDLVCTLMMMDADPQMELTEPQVREEVKAKIGVDL